MRVSQSVRAVRSDQEGRGPQNRALLPHMSYSWNVASSVRKLAMLSNYSPIEAFFVLGSIHEVGCSS